MKKRSLLFALCTALFLSCGAISFTNKPKIAKADDDVIDVGTIDLSIHEALADWNNGTGLFLDGTPSNAIPQNWDKAFHPISENAVLRDGEDITKYEIVVKKHTEYENGYYLGLSDGGYGTRHFYETIVLQGTWQGESSDGKTYKMTFNPITVIWNGSKWIYPFEEPEYEKFDKVTLIDAGYDDIDRISFDYENNPSSWNTFAWSEGNTTNSFAFEFEFESFGNMTSDLDIRIGGEAAWGKGHHYRFILKNTNGANSKGSIILREQNLDDILHNFGQASCDLKPGSKHTIEFGSKKIKNQDEYLVYAKYDGYCLIHESLAIEDGITSRVGLYYSSNNIFLGSTHSQRENAETLTFDPSGSDLNGVYFNTETTNNIPSSWTEKGAPASIYNVLRNGAPLYEHNSSKLPPLTKAGDQKYYLSFSDHQITINDNDIVTLAGEFHFYIDGKTYVMAIKPVGFYYENGAFHGIDNIYAYYYNKLENSFVADYYSDDDLFTIYEVLEAAEANLVEGKTIKELWDLYEDYQTQIDNVPIDEEKLQQLIQQEKTKAINELNSCYQQDAYDSTHLATVQGIVNSAIEVINGLNSIDAIRQKVQEAKAAIAEVETIQDAIEKKIIDCEEGYEQYLEKYDRVTTTDLCAIGDLSFYPNGDNRSYSSGGLDDFTTNVAVSSDNEHGNLAFQFKLKTNGAEKEFARSHIYIRLRGTDATCYRFDLPYLGGVRVTAYDNDAYAEEDDKSVASIFESNEEYFVELGSIDLKDYDRTLLYVKVKNIKDTSGTDSYVIRFIVDSVVEEPTPTIRIMESYTPDEVVTTMSPVETGTSKYDKAVVIGRPVLDPSSDDKALVFTLRDNAVPVSGSLYALEQNALLINGEEKQSGRPGTYISKTDSKTYVVNMDDATREALASGGTVSLKGLFSHFNSTSLKKTVYKLLETEFTYDATSKKWAQNDPTLADAKYEAKETLKAPVDMSNYSETSQTTINNIINSYSNDIEVASSVEQVNALLEEALTKIGNVPTLLDDYKTAAKQELNNYKSADLYRDEEKRELNNILQGAFENIDKAENKDSVNSIVAKAKEDIDKLTTAAERDAEDLKNEKKNKTAELQVYFGLLEPDRYSDENWLTLYNMERKAESDIENATSIDQINSIVDSFKKAVKGIETKDGSTFDGEKYIEPEVKKKKGCRSEIVATSTAIATISLFGVVLLLLKKKSFLTSEE